MASDHYNYCLIGVPGLPVSGRNDPVLLRRCFVKSKQHEQKHQAACGLYRKHASASETDTEALCKYLHFLSSAICVLTHLPWWLVKDSVVLQHPVFVKCTVKTKSTIALE